MAKSSDKTQKAGLIFEKAKSQSLVETRLVDKELAAERRAYIVQKAMPIFLEKGFHKATIRDIADATGWFPGTLYLYIKKKEDLLYLIIQQVADDLWQKLDAVEIVDSPREYFKNLLRRYFDEIRRLSGEVLFMYRETQSLLPLHLEALKHSEIRIIQRFEAVIRGGAEAGEFASNINPTLAALNTVMLAHTWALKSWVINSELHMDHEAFTEQQISFLINSCQFRQADGSQ